MIAIMAVALIAITMGLWAYQLMSGLKVTNMRTLDSWGLYITNFMFMVGLSAGGLIISSAPKVFNLKGFEGISKVAIWTSICCTVLAMAFVIIDMGNPLRIWELIASPNVTSPLVWDVAVLTLYLVLSIFYLRNCVRAEKGIAGHLSQKVFSTVALLVAILVHSVTAWVFSLEVSHEFWHTALMAPWFVVSALSSGLALVIVVCVVLSKTGYLELGQDLLGKLVRLLGVFVAVDLFFLGCDVLTCAYGNADGREIAQMLTIGALAPFFWTEVLGGLVAMFLCFYPKMRTRGWATVAAALAIIGVFCKRCQIILAGFGITNIDGAGVTVYSSFPLSDIGQSCANIFSNLVYFPSPFEFLVVLCVIASGVAVFALGVRCLPLRPSEEQ